MVNLKLSKKPYLSHGHYMYSTDKLLIFDHRFFKIPQSTNKLAESRQTRHKWRVRVNRIFCAQIQPISLQTNIYTLNSFMSRFHALNLAFMFSVCK